MGTALASSARLVPTGSHNANKNIEKHHAISSRRRSRHANTINAM